MKEAFFVLTNFYYTYRNLILPLRKTIFEKYEVGATASDVFDATTLV